MHASWRTAMLKALYIACCCWSVYVDIFTAFIRNAFKFQATVHERSIRLFVDLNISAIRKEESVFKTNIGIFS